MRIERIGAARVVPLVLLAGLASFGCGGEPADGGDDAFAVRDSSGVRIVEADWDRMPVLDSVGADPLFTLGGQNEVALNRVRAARFLPDGRIVVGHGGSPEVIVVDRASGEVTTIATAGDGPEELGSVAALRPEGSGEQVGVYDPARRRYAIFDPDDGLVDELSLRDVWPGRGGPAVTMWAPPAFLPVDGRAYFVGARADVPDAGDASRAELPLIRVRGSRVDTVTRYRGHEFIRSGRNVGPLLLGDRVVFAASVRGVWVGDTGEPSASRWSGPGAPELTVRWNRNVDRTVTEENVRSILRRIMDQVPPSQRQRARQYAERAPLPDSLPAYGALLMDDTGVLWVGEHYGIDNPRVQHLPDEPRQWALFAADGTPRGRVVTPPRVEVLDVRSDRLLGVHRSELGVETVRVYPVDR